MREIKIKDVIVASVIVYVFLLGLASIIESFNSLFNSEGFNLGTHIACGIGAFICGVVFSRYKPNPNM